jgi:hypothetical protein
MYAGGGKPKKASGDGDGYENAGDLPWTSFFLKLKSKNLFAEIYINGNRKKQNKYISELSDYITEPLTI